MIKETLRLFNAIQVELCGSTEAINPPLERTIKNGYILDPAIQPTEELLDIIESVVGLSGEKANAAFHKSWQVVQDTPMELLMIQQIIHYITTYGFERLGIYRQDAVYIPNEVLELPGIHENIPLVVIKTMTSKDILKNIISLGSGIALAQETLDDIMSIIQKISFDSAFVDEIGNRELKALLYDFYGLVPSDPIEFLRYLVYKLTGESLLIKNEALIQKIKESDGAFLDVWLKDAPDDLASIFFRFKPLFLAMKSISSNKTFFNRLRKQADKLHIPMPEDFLNGVTTQLKAGKFDVDVLAHRLKTAPIFRKIRLAYALNHRLHPGGSIVYRVRNGRGWATEFEWPANLKVSTQQALDVVFASIVEDIRKNVEGKTIYIPENVHYALPATEKQFTGHLPTGSYVSVPKDMIVGIHWTNTESRVDLDLSVIDEEGKIGWDDYYRTEELDVLFSGDVTDAPPPDGASELFYLREGVSPRVMMVNYFNHEEGEECEAKILVASENLETLDKNYMVDVSNIVAEATINITKKQDILGLIVSTDDESRFYFANVNVGNSITSRRGIQSEHARKYLLSSLVDSLYFRDILNAAGAKVVSKKPDSEHLDLSPEALDRTTIINMIV